MAYTIAALDRIRDREPAKEAMPSVTVLPVPHEKLDSTPDIRLALKESSTGEFLPFLPSPPGDDEAYWYFGPQRRWVPAFASLSFTFTAIALFSFSISEPALWIFVAILGLNVVGQVMSLLDTQNRRRLIRESHDLLIRA